MDLSAEALRVEKRRAWFANVGKNRPPYLLTLGEAAAALGLGLGTVDQYCKQGRLGHVVLTFRRGLIVARRRFVPRACVVEFLSRRASDQRFAPRAKRPQAQVCGTRMLYYPALGSRLTLQEVLRDAPVPSSRPLDDLPDCDADEYLARNRSRYLQALDNVARVAQERGDLRTAVKAYKALAAFGGECTRG
jgi:hypothetical protein